MRILLVEDHRELRDLIAGHFAGRGFAVDAVGTAGEARAAMSSGGYDVLILDLGLPDSDGMELLRAAPMLVAGGLPTLVVTARDSLEDRLLGLNEGADDYLVKPFSLLELEARLRAVMRRPGTREGPKLACGALAYDAATREVSVRGEVIEMSRRESDLLEALLRASGRVVVRDLLEEQLYSANEPVTANALEAVVSRLRRRLTNAEAGVRVETRRGIGYRLVAESSASGGEP
jgi:DNA-binding response OmpR family regulator